MARRSLRLGSWPLPLRWLLAVLVVPTIPFITTVLLSAVFSGLGLMIPTVVAGVLSEMILPTVPVAWLTILPLYFALGRWWRHSRWSYIAAAVLAALFLLLAKTGHLLLTGPVDRLSFPLLGIWFAATLVTAALIGAMVWWVLWWGRESEQAK
ncbi:hypothetical protein [Pelagibius marinus]|uniref:hypothetical protein n=1 Tax=Pelagibius marinus TaxID=2762760 RepID=UPI001872D9EE|nr:hypothetical protein [Pelagibius marinus]